MSHKHDDQKPHNKWEQFQEEHLPEEENLSANQEDTNPSETTATASDSKTNDLEDQIAHWKDRFVRSQAEMQNLKTRLERDIENAHKYSIEKLIRELLPIVDSLEKSLEVEADETVKTGVKMTLEMFYNVLKKFHVTIVNPDGEMFNPNHHEAISTAPVPDKAPNSVIQVLQKGYLLNDRLVRPALVVVAKAP